MINLLLNKVSVDPLISYNFFMKKNKGFTGLIKNYCWQKSARQIESKLNLNHNAHVGVNDQIRSLERLSRSTVRLPQIRRLTAGVKRAKLVQISIQKTCLTQILFLTKKWLAMKKIFKNLCAAFLNRISFLWIKNQTTITVYMVDCRMHGKDPRKVRCPFWSTVNQTYPPYEI